MAGVAGPMLRESRGAGVRFLSGLAAGGVMAAVVLAVPGYLLGALLHATVPAAARLWLLIAVSAAFGAADLLGRTPHVWRQVPQTLVRRLPPGPLGVVWGFDLGLLVTTQKVTSLIWAAVAAALLVRPSAVAAVLVTVAVLTNAAVAGWSLHERRTQPPEQRRRLVAAWTTHVRRASGTTLLILSILTAVGM